MAQRKMPKRKAKIAALDIANRFPNGGCDTLDAEIMLGNQYKSIDRNDFGNVAKGANGRKKRFAVK